MAIAFDAEAFSSSGSTTSLTYSHTCATGGTLLVATSAFGGSQPVSGVTYNGVALTKIAASETHTTQCGWIAWWYLANPASGANNVVVTLSAGQISSFSASYTGVLTTSFPDSVSTGNASSGTSIATSLTTFADKCWTVIFAISNQNTQTLNAGSGTTQRSATAANGLFIGDSNGAIHPAGSNTLNVTEGGAGGFWLTTMISMAPAPIAQSLSVVATGVAGMSFARLFLKTFTTVASGVVSLTHVFIAVRTFTVTATGVVSLTTSTILRWILEQKNALIHLILEPKQDNTE